MTMRAALFNSYGPAENLIVGELPDPVPGRGEVLVRVDACAVNPKDSFIRKGRFRALTGRRFPQQVGMDFAGTIEGLGEGVLDFSPGERVYGMVNSVRGRACAELVALEASAVARSPATMTPVDVSCWCARVVPTSKSWLDGSTQGACDL